jgi:hypothetical protein
MNLKLSSVDSTFVDNCCCFADISALLRFYSRISNVKFSSGFGLISFAVANRIFRLYRRFMHLLHPGSCALGSRWLFAFGATGLLLRLQTRFTKSS